MDRDDLERELERLHPESFGWALACCDRDRDRAGDALQGAYLRVLSGAARFDGRSTLRTWLFGVIRRVAMEDRRRAGRFGDREPGDGDVQAVPDTTAAADAQLESSERHRELAAALGVLSPRQREVLVLVFYHDLTIEEAARAMDVSLGSARTHYDRGKKAMLARLTEGARR